MLVIIDDIKNSSKFNFFKGLAGNICNTSNNMIFIILDHDHNLTNHIYYTADIKFYYNGRDEDMVSPEGCCNYELAISSVVTLGSREELYGLVPIVVENNEDEDDDVEVDSRAPTRYGEDDGANDYQEDEDRDYVCCDYSPEVVEAEDDVKCTLSMYFKFIKKIITR